MDLYQMFCDRIDNDSGYDNAKLAKDLIAMIPNTALNKVASSQPIIQSGKLTKCQCIKPDDVHVKICLECNGICHSV